MSDSLVIQSHRGPYTVVFDDSLLSDVQRLCEGPSHFLVDANVARLYAATLAPILQRPTTIVIEATEENKSIDRIIPVFERLVRDRVRRDHALVAIGGGIVQDVTCFVASTLLRGLPWRFVPTTLLAQADSCIGSKSSVNLAATKNILGTFNPPESIVVDSGFLETLDRKDIHSGVGEIIKVHAIDGVESFDRLAADFDRLFTDRTVMLKYVRAALLVKKRFIEVDEFDRDVRNVFNYGHSFGHAIESATHYGVPHGIAVTIGMEMANYVAMERGLLPASHYQRMRPVLCRNAAVQGGVHVPLDGLLSALTKDKKNTDAMLRLILPVGDAAAIQRVQVPLDDAFKAQCAKSLAELAG